MNNFPRWRPFEAIILDTHHCNLIFHWILNKPDCIEIVVWDLSLFTHITMFSPSLLNSSVDFFLVINSNNITPKLYTSFFSFTFNVWSYSVSTISLKKNYISIIKNYDKNMIKIYTYINTWFFLQFDTQILRLIHSTLLANFLCTFC